MKIAVIGLGNVGSTLGRGLAGRGHEVTFGVRDPSKATPPPPATSIRGIAEAVGPAGVVVLAVPWDAAESALRACGDQSGKVLLDCINPVAPDFSGLAVGQTTSAGEQVAAWAPDARVVKVFNTTGAENMGRPTIRGQALTMFLAGDDPEAKEVAATLARDLGFDPVDAGPLARARLLEPLAMLWITLALMQGHGTRIALQLLKE